MIAGMRTRKRVVFMVSEEFEFMLKEAEKMFLGDSKSVIVL